MAPSLGPHFKRLKWWAMSGKAMCGAVPPARTAFQGVMRVEESKGHVAQVSGLLVHLNKALPTPKTETPAAVLHHPSKPMT